MYSYDVVALGELLIDFTTNGTSAQGNPILEANPGGAPCNVLALLAKMGRSAAFIGKVGQDAFGNQLEAALEEVGIATQGLKKDPKSTPPWPWCRPCPMVTGISASTATPAPI